MNFIKQRSCQQARCFFVFFVLSMSSWLCGQSRGDFGQVGQLWQEFVEVYSQYSFEKLSPDEIEQKMFESLKNSPRYRIHQDGVTSEGFLPQLVQVAELSKLSSVDLLEDLIVSFCPKQSKHDHYLRGEDWRLMAEVNRGQRAGVGMQLNQDATGRYSLTPFVGSPAEKAGVQDGDELLEVEGRQASRLSVAQIRGLVLGAVGSELTIRVKRVSGGEQVIRIVRGEHREPLVSLQQQVTGYTLKIRNFNRGSAQLIFERLQEIPEDSRVTIDLRGNVGGEMSEVAKAASFFLPDQALIYRHEHRDGSVELVRDEDGYQAKFRSIQIQIDRYTASAAELFTVALASQPGVSLLGEKSYGKNMKQDERTLPSGGLLTIATGVLSGPEGEDWGSGIDPARP